MKKLFNDLPEALENNYNYHLDVILDHNIKTNFTKNYYRNWRKSNDILKKSLRMVC